MRSRATLSPTNTPTEAIDGEMGRVGVLTSANSESWDDTTRALLTLPPCTMSCWFKTSDVSNLMTLMGFGNDGVDKHEQNLILRGDTAGDEVEANSRSGAAGGVQATTTTGYSANTWHLAVGVWAGLADRRVYIDGGSKGTNTTIKNPTLTVTSIGRNPRPTPIWFYNGRIVDARIYNRILSDAEIFALWHPRSRWDLYAQPRLHVKAVAVVGGISIPIVHRYRQMMGYA